MTTNSQNCIKVDEFVEILVRLSLSFFVFVSSANVIRNAYREFWWHGREKPFGVVRIYFGAEDDVLTFVSVKDSLSFPANLHINRRMPSKSWL
jgi:hypothetical protein